MTKTMQYFSIYALAIIIICAADLTRSDAQEYKDYTVKKGDTLWGISSKEISDPFLWPKVWKENPEVKNPDLIYPGQLIKIPLKLTRQETAPAPQPQPKPHAEEPVKVVSKAPPQPESKKEKSEEKTAVPITPVERKYLVDRDAFIASGFISDNVDHIGKIIGAPSERSVFGEGDYVYVTTLKPVNVNDRFYIIRSLGPVKHPLNGAKLGYLIDVLGIAEIVGQEGGETKARIVSSFDGILNGDLLNDFSEPDVPYLVERPRTPDVSGVIVAAKKRRTLNGMLSFVYIDKGEKDGLEAGDVLKILSKNQYTIPNGSVQIINVKEKTSTAIVKVSDKEVAVGDLVVPAGEGGSAAKVRQTPTGGSLEEEANLFMSQYASAYESGDIDKFMSFYSSSAVENNNLHYDDIKRAYERNFRDNRYEYALRDVQMQKNDDIIILTGTYSIRRLQGGATGTTVQGNIKWTLRRENGSLKIIRVDYDRV